MYVSHLSLGFCERRYVIFMLCKLTLSCYFATLKIVLLAFPILALNFCTLCDVRGFCISSIANSNLPISYNASFVRLKKLKISFKKFSKHGVSYLNSTYSSTHVMRFRKACCQ